MAFYDLSKSDRVKVVAAISESLLNDLTNNSSEHFLLYFDDEDTYIRKSAYLSIGRIYFLNKQHQRQILKMLSDLQEHESFKVRQTVINAAGEIGKKEFEVVQDFFDKGLFDKHHSPRNAVIGSIKKMGEVNPTPVLEWSKIYLRHPHKEIRREICHGIELRGRKFPEDILPLLRQLENDKEARVRNTLVHVIGQIAYKPGCLEKVTADLKKNWGNKKLVEDALEEIIDVHDRYKDFSAMTQDEAAAFIRKKFPELKV